jgi:hypothetical protein
MGLLSGKATFARYRVAGRAPGGFGPEHLDRLARHAIGKQRLVSADGVEIGWIAGDHILDTRFDLAKNIVGDALHFELRVDRLKIPADLLRAYTMAELEGLAAANPSGRPSARQRREARANARERLEQEARDGRFVQRKAYPILWDSQSNELLVGSTGVTVVDRLLTLFQQTFDRGFEALGAGQQAFRLAEARQQTRGIDDAAPAAFVPGVSPSDIVWLMDESSRDFLGNEFLLWLWHILDEEDDTIKLTDGSEVTAMFARTLLLECPRGKTGKETITSDGPTRLPEARRAIQAGKLPRRAGLTLVRHDQQYELTLHAESLAVIGAKLPAPEGEEERTRLEERIASLRGLIETLDLLFDAFGQARAGASWPKLLTRMRKWLQNEKDRTG